jgi:FtsX-like permease family protein
MFGVGDWADLHNARPARGVNAVWSLVVVLWQVRGGLHRGEARGRPGWNGPAGEALEMACLRGFCEEHRRRIRRQPSMDADGGLVSPQQSREIAIRMALGGDRLHVLRHVFRMGLQLMGAGVVVGLAASVVTNRLLVNQLWKTSPHDPMTLVSVISIVVVIGMCACWVPARRAVRVEPIAALRHE